MTTLRPFPTWHVNPNYEQQLCLVDGDVKDGKIVEGSGPGIIATVEDFGYAAYPTALNPMNAQWERHGPTLNRVHAIAWCERIAGLHPLNSGDGVPAFYYQSRCQRNRENHCARCRHSFGDCNDFDRPKECIDNGRPMGPE